MRIPIPTLAAILLAVPAAAAQTTPTELLVRAVAHDAKIIGSGVGGARITIRNADTGEVLAAGVQEGSTGNTEAIMNPTRGATVFDTEGAAGFRTTLHLDVPTRVEITAEGPLAASHAMQTTSKTVLIVPGVHLLGEGVVLGLSGFTVELVTELPDVVSGSDGFDVTARVTMLCGCPTSPGGLWDSNDYRIWARLVDGVRTVASAELTFAGETSTYTGRLSTEETGELELQVIAVDAGTANTGMVSRPLIVR